MGAPRDTWADAHQSEETEAHRGCFGSLNTIALLRKVRHRGTLMVDWLFTFACAAYNLVRLRNLMAATVRAQ